MGCSEDRTSWRAAAVIIALIMCLAACATKGLKVDQALAALGVRDAQQAGDATVIIEGTSPPPVGFHYIRMQQGQVAEGSVFLQVPPAECRPAEAPCVDWLVIRPDGTDFGGQVPRGQTRVAIPVRQLFNSDRADIGSRGPFGVLLTVRWVDEQGRDRESRAEGEVYVRVVRQGYRSLHATPQSPDFVWSWASGGRVYRMTSGLRAYAGAQ